MQHTLIAVFEQRTEAQQALDALLGAGFPAEHTRMTEDKAASTATPGAARPTLFANRDLDTSNAHIEGTTTDSTYQEGTSIGSSVRNFFNDLFGNERDRETRLYTSAVERGHFVLTVRTDSEPEVERAADIVEGFGPIDIDEKSEQWGLDSGSSEPLRAGSAAQQPSAQQQSSSFAQQSAGAVGGAGGAGAAGGVGAAGSAGASGAAGRGGPAGPTASASATGAAGAGAPQGRGQYQGSQLQATEQRQGETTAIPVIQEELNIGKREVSRGGVRVYQHLRETPVDQTVGLREEHVRVDRRATDKLVDPADIDAFKDTTIELREVDEEAVVSKQARQVEEVRVGKDVSQREEHIHDTLRRTEVEVERLPEESTGSFRSHWDTHYASAGGKYEEYEPAYRYGSEARGSAQYRDRPWEEVESDLRSDWERRHPGSAWDRFKAAVRHGWDRLVQDEEHTWRTHWKDNYNTGTDTSFDEFAPAYKYGSEARRSELYRNRPWDDVETDLRSHWEHHHPGSAWERFKSAVRHGWDRITS
jgi:uncharacterized protein (TIGR02271 family)